MRYVFSRVVMSVAMLATFLMPASAQQYPTKQIQMIIPFGVGGDVDTFGRLISAQIAEQLKIPVIPENRPGGGSGIGAKIVATAKPDGYTLLLASTALFIANAANPKLGFDPRVDLVPIATVALGPFGLIVSENFPAKDIGSWIAAVRSNPGKFSYSSSGQGSGFHLFWEGIKQAGNLDILHVPYKSGGEAGNAVMKNEVDFTIHNVAFGRVNAGKARLLASLSETRESTPEVPTLKEAGINFSAYAWYGLLGPRNLPPEIVKKLNAIVNQALTTPPLRQMAQTAGYDLVQHSPDETEKFMSGEYEKFAKAVKAANFSMTE